MQSLRENSKLLKLLFIPIIAAFVLVLEPPDEIIQWFSLTYEGVPAQV